MGNDQAEEQEDEDMGLLAHAAPSVGRKKRAKPTDEDIRAHIESLNRSIEALKYASTREAEDRNALACNNAHEWFHRNEISIRYDKSKEKWILVE